MNKYIPTRMTRMKERPPWITSDIKRLLRKTRKLFEKQKGSAYASRASQHYRSLKAFTQKSIRKAYWRYIEGIITDKDDDDSPASHKKFWRFVKHRKQDVQGVAPLKKNGKLVDNPVEKANILNNQFQSVFSARNPLSLKTLSTRAANSIKPDGTPNDTPQMLPVDITEEGVRRRLQTLNPHKAAGPDKLNPLVLREIADVIAPVITRLYREHHWNKQRHQMFGKKPMWLLSLKKEKSTKLSTTVPLRWPAFCVSKWNISWLATSWNT